MSFNFGTPVTSASADISFGTPAGDAKTTKPEFSLFGSPITTQNSAGFGFTSPSAGINPLDVSSAQATPLSTPTFRKGTSIFGANQTAQSVPSLFGPTTSAPPATMLGTSAGQTILPSFGSTEQSTFKSSPGTGLLGSSFQTFGAANVTLTQPTASSYNVPQSIFGASTQATAAGGQISAPTFGTTQSTTAAVPQFSFGATALAKPQITTEATSTSSYPPALNVPKPTATVVPPMLSSFGLAYTTTPVTATTAPIFSLGSNNASLSTLPSVTPASVPSTGVPVEFALRIPSVTATSDANLVPSTVTPAQTAASGIAGSGALPVAGPSVTKPLGSVLPAFGGLTATNSSTLNTVTSSMPTGTSTAAVTFTSVVPSIASSISTGFTVPTSTIAKSTATSTVPPTVMTYGQLEDLINKWTLDLENQSKIFTNQAKQLNAWDRLLISNGDKILSLNNSIERVKQQQNSLDQDIDFIKAQQKELEHLIAPLEKELQETPVTDTDRNHTYQLAENMDSQLKQMSEDIKEIIETLNESNKNQELANPITQIGRILNAHMNSLQWIDVNSNKISSQLDQISKMHDLNRRNHEIVLQRTYD